MEGQIQLFGLSEDPRTELRYGIRGGDEKEIIENAGKILGFDKVELIDVEKLAKERRHKVVWQLTDTATVTRFIVDWDKRELRHDDKYVESWLKEQGLKLNFEFVEEFDNEEDLAYTIWADKKNGIIKVYVEYFVEGDWKASGHWEQYCVFGRIKQ